MSEIKVGDLVMVVHTCCGLNGGTVFRVGEIENGRCQCSGCKKLTPFPVATNKDWSRSGQLLRWPLDWLKRIDPPAIDTALPTSTQTTEEMTI